MDDDEAEMVWAMLQKRNQIEAAQADEDVQLQRLREINAMLDVNPDDDDDGLLDASEHSISYDHLTFDTAIAEVHLYCQYVLSLVPALYSPLTSNHQQR